MRNILTLFFILFFVFSFFNCTRDFTNFLEKPPSVDLTLDSVLSSKRRMDSYVAGMFAYSLPLEAIPHGPNTGSVANLSGATDEGNFTAGFFGETLNWNLGNISASSGADPAFEPRWQALRRINTLLENIDKSTINDKDYLTRVKGETHFLRAIVNFDMFKKYGGIPLVDKVITDTTTFRRSSLESTIKFILDDLELALPLLPDLYPSNLTGHITKGAVLMLRSNTLLFAASPLFNTNDPYLDLGNNNDLICFGNYDPNRWRAAADAAKEVLDWAKQGYAKLITDQGVEANYEYVYTTPDNSEVLLTDRSLNYVAYNSGFVSFKAQLPKTIVGGYGGLTVPLNFVKRYEKRDGTPQEWDFINGGDRLKEKYAELDYRFTQTMVSVGQYWNEDKPVLESWQGGAEGEDNIAGVFARKPVPKEWSNLVEVIPMEIILQLSEAYLNFAEASNEFYGPTSEAYEAINTLRNRSGLPNLPLGLNKEQFRERVRNERAIELAYNGTRLADLRRWLIADSPDTEPGSAVMDGDMYGIKIYDLGKDNYKYEPYIFQKRTFIKRMYLYPWPQSEVNKGYLIQNPEY